jgi:hypothetical protein
MTKKIGWIVLAASVCLLRAAVADEVVTTKSGQKALLKDDGTWTLVPGAQVPVPAPGPGPDAEAQANLRGLFTSEKAFFGEYNVFGSDLVSISWIPDGTPTYLYGSCSQYPTTGIPGIPGYDGRRNNTWLPSVRSRSGSPPAYSDEKTAAIGDPCAALRKLGLEKDMAVTANGFLLFAIGNLDRDADLDVWTIDNNRQLKHVRSDL